MDIVILQSYIMAFFAGQVHKLGTDFKRILYQNFLMFDTTEH